VEKKKKRVRSRALQIKEVQRGLSTCDIDPSTLWSLVFLLIFLTLLFFSFFSFNCLLPQHTIVQRCSTILKLQYAIDLKLQWRCGGARRERVQALWWPYSLFRVESFFFPLLFYLFTLSTLYILLISLCVAILSDRVLAYRGIDVDPALPSNVRLCYNASELPGTGFFLLKKSLKRGKIINIIFYHISSQLSLKFQLQAVGCLAICKHNQLLRISAHGLASR
jgi:hypothetical protein